MTLSEAPARPAATPAPVPAFWVRDVPIYGELVLAPMAGYTDRPYRSICRRLGAAWVVTELLSADGLLHASERTRQMLAFGEDERPLAMQLFGRDAAVLEAAARLVEPFAPDFIDLNLGCSVPKVTKTGAGAGLLSDPVNVGRIMARLTRAVRVPVTAKIRLGPERETLNYLEVARALEDNGAALIAVHGRTRHQRYNEPADWDAIAAVKQAVRIPVVGNGDVNVVADIARMKAHTGCDAVMIGRAAQGHPWIFQYRDRKDVPWEERRTVMLEHLERMAAHYGPRYGVIHFRKHLVRYLRGAPVPKALYPALLEATQPEALRALLCSIAAGDVGQ
ncbi:MAG: tRNA dihydrouridine synthase DusB [Anaerolineae bacterium]|nr:tRNA dihydrouridine synthase DusB [Anaerolineae bacterium]